MFKGSNIVRVQVDNATAAKIRRAADAMKLSHSDVVRSSIVAHLCATGAARPATPARPDPPHIRRTRC